MDRARIGEVEKLIRPHLRRTPVIEADGLVLKLELFVAYAAQKLGTPARGRCTPSAPWESFRLATEPGGAAAYAALGQTPAVDFSR